MAPQGFFTDKNGVVHPINGKKKAKTGGAVLAGALLAGLAAAANGGGATASIGAGLDAATAARADARTASSERDARAGNEARAWRRMGLREIRKIARQRLRCPLQSYGQVREFFLRTPCDSLDQVLIPLADDRGNVLVVSVMWVRLPSAADAADFQRLEDTYGTGDVTPVATELLRAGGIRFTGRHYRSRRDGRLVALAEAEPLHGRPSATLLDDAAAIAVVLPPP